MSRANGYKIKLSKHTHPPPPNPVSIQAMGGRQLHSAPYIVRSSQVAFRQFALPSLMILPRLFALFSTFGFGFGFGFFISLNPHFHIYFGGPLLTCHAYLCFVNLCHQFLPFAWTYLDEWKMLLIQNTTLKGKVKKESMREPSSMTPIPSYTIQMPAHSNIQGLPPPYSRVPTCH